MMAVRKIYDGYHGTKTLKPGLSHPAYVLIIFVIPK
jgi:hypothetical protein